MIIMYSLNNSNELISKLNLGVLLEFLDKNIVYRLFTWHVSIKKTYIDITPLQ